MFSNTQVNDDIVAMWGMLFRTIASIHGDLSRLSAFTDAQLTALEVKIDEFMHLYVEVLGAQAITPYVHVLEMHVVEAIRESPMRSIAAYGSFSLERKNGTQSLAFFRNSMKNGGRWNRSDGFSSRANNLKGLFERELVLNFSPELKPHRFPVGNNSITVVFYVLLILPQVRMNSRSAAFEFFSLSR